MGIFEDECDRVSRIADPEGFEAMDWDNGDGRILATTVDLIEGTFGSRDDLAIERATAEHHRGRLVLKTSVDRGSDSIVDINVSISGGEAVIWASTAGYSSFKVLGNKVSVA